MSKTPWLKRVLGDPDGEARLQTAVSELEKQGRQIEALEANLEDVCRQLDKCEIELRSAAQREEALASAVVSAEARAAKAETVQKATRAKARKLQQEGIRERQEANRLVSLHKARVAKLEQDRVERKAYQDTIRARADVLLQEGQSLKTKLVASEQSAGQVQQRHEEQLEALAKHSNTLTSSLAIKEQTLHTVRQRVLSLVRLAAASSSEILGARAHLAVELAVQSGVQCLTADASDSATSGPTAKESKLEPVINHFRQLAIAREIQLESGTLRIIFFEKLDFSPNAARWIAAYVLECLNQANGLTLRIDSVETFEGGLNASCSPRLPE